MKKVITAIGLLLAPTVWAHHTREHMMLLEDAAQVIADTREGANGDLQWLLWSGVLLLLLVGMVRWWAGRSKS